MAADFMPVAFSFKVSFLTSIAGADASFQEVSGLESTVDVESYVEGGENRFVHSLPKSVTHTNLTLKRGIASALSPLVIWCKSTFDAGFAVKIKPMPLLVSLMNEEQEPVRVWSLTNAYPVKWSVDSFNSTKNEVVIETIELNYATCIRIEI